MKLKSIALFCIIPVVACNTGLSSLAQNLTKNQCDLLIKQVGLFDGVEDKGIVDIAIKNGSIIWISPHIKNFSSQETIDGKGKYIIPGLINAHVHLWNKTDLQVALQVGVFAVIDLHSSEGPDDAFRKLRDSANYASYYSAGYAATVPKGHPTQLFPIETINDSISPAQFVDHRIDKGADLIKIVSGSLRPGSLWYSNPSLNYDQVNAITQAAKSRNKMVLVHVSQIDETVKIAAMGVDGFAHLWSYNDVATDEQLKKLKEKNIFIIPTALIQERAWKTVENNPNEKNEFKGSLSEMPVVYKEIERVYKAGITIVAGTDPPGYGINYTDDLLAELNIYARAGLSNKEVLKTATGNPAGVFHFLNGLGLVREGTKANFILLNSNPLTSLSALKEINTIWKNGEKVVR